MIRTQVYLTDEQVRDIKLRAKREKKREAEVIRDLLKAGLDTARSTPGESAGDALLRLATLGKRLNVKLSPDLSSRVDDYLYGNL
jgi:hypothetical protein